MKCQYWTACSRLPAQVLALLTFTFGSLEVHFCGGGTALLWFRKVRAKELSEVLAILDQLLNRLAHYEVLEVFPSPRLLGNRPLLGILRSLNGFMIESALRTLVKFNSSNK